MGTFLEIAFDTVQSSGEDDPVILRYQGRTSFLHGAYWTTRQIRSSAMYSTWCGLVVQMRSSLNSSSTLRYQINVFSSRYHQRIYELSRGAKNAVELKPSFYTQESARLLAPDAF